MTEHRTVAHPAQRQPADQQPMREDHQPLAVEAFLRLSQNEDAYQCEILAGNPEYCHHVVYDSGGEVVLSSEYPMLKRYTLTAPREARRGVSRRTAEHQAFSHLVQWIAVVLREIIGAERASAISLGSPPGERGAHWLIAPLCGSAARVVPFVLGMEQMVLPLSERGVGVLAGQLRRALAA